MRCNWAGRTTRQMEHVWEEEGGGGREGGGGEEGEETDAGGLVVAVVMVAAGHMRIDRTSRVVVASSMKVATSPAAECQSMWQLMFQTPAPRCAIASRATMLVRPSFVLEGSRVDRASVSP